MKPVYKSLRFENDTCWVEVRLHPNGTVSAHYKANDGKTYENQPSVVVAGSLEIDEQALYAVAVRPFGVGHDDQINELKSMMRTAIKELLDTNVRVAFLKDHSENGDGVLPVAIHIDNQFIAIRPQGHGECEAADGYGTPILLEHYEGKCFVRVWPDINQADPQNIDMSGALESNRTELEA